MNDKNKITETLKSFSMPSYEQIPDVGLYLDQVAKFINSFLTDFPEMNVTPSMISNYAKQKLINRVNRKTYTRDQITALIMIVLCKTVISIDHVRLMLEEIRSENESMEPSYRFFCAALHEALVSMYSDSDVKEAECEKDTQIMIRNIVIALARKMYLERYFDSLSENESMS